MSRTHYQIYKEQTFVLARTLIVKHEEIASTMNTELYYRGYVVDDNPYHWRYYLNLSGEYHVADRDAIFNAYGTEYLMVKIPSEFGIISVPFTKELLHAEDADKSIANEYQIGSKFYNELVSIYPDYETLIIGILNPVDIDVAVNAQNGEILHIAGRYKVSVDGESRFDLNSQSVNDKLIEPQEDNLVLALQQYIYDFLRHWNNPAYAKANDLYVPTMLGILYCQIPSALYNIRLGNCKTIRAHTFHIRQYLESHGQIGRYIDTIPIHTTLWLYRNVLYLEANVGKQLTFDAYLDNVLTPNEIPMSAYAIRHELSGLSDDKLLPTGMLYKEVLNFEVIGASDNDRTVRDILKEEIPLARDNALDLDESEAKIQDAIDWGGDDRINSKVLESEMMDLGEPYPFTLSEMLLNIWGYTANLGTYNASIYATNPITGDRLSFTAKNAYILATYCLNRAIAGIKLKNIPSFRFYHIPRSTEEYLLPTDIQYTPRPAIDSIMSTCSSKTRRLKVLELVGSHSPKFQANDNRDFFANVSDMYDERVRKYNVYCDVEELEERGDLERIGKDLYWMGFEETMVTDEYSEWFRNVGFDPSNYSVDNLLILGLELVANGSGISDDEMNRRRWMQRSLLAIMKHFISYTVHVIEKFTDGVVAYLEGKSIRFSNIEWQYVGGLPVKYNLLMDYSTHVSSKCHVHLDISDMFEMTNVNVTSKAVADFDLSMFEYNQSRMTIHAGVYSLNAHINDFEVNVEESIPLRLHVVDDMNAVVLGPITAFNREQLVRVKTIVDDNALLVTNQYGRVIDDVVTSFTLDQESATLGITNVSVKVTGGESDTSSPNSDTSGIGVSGIYGNIDDAEITDIHVIDVVGMVNANINTNVIVTGNTAQIPSDSETLVVNQMSVITSNNEIMSGVYDDNYMTIGTITLSYIDPEIPAVNVSDDESVIVSNITMSSKDSFDDSMGYSASAITVGTITIEMPEDNVDLTINDLETGVVVGPISAGVKDIGSSYRELDINTLYVSNITMSVRDDYSDAGFEDEQTVFNGNITVNINDTVDGAASSHDSLLVTNITATTSNDSSGDIITNDTNVVTVSSISMSYRDLPDSAESSDTDTIVTTVSGKFIDSSVDVSVTPDNVGVVIKSVSVQVDNAVVNATTVSTDALLSNGISGGVTDFSVAHAHLDVATITPAAQLITVTLNDIEVDVANPNVDALTINLGDITIAINDE